MAQPAWFAGALGGVSTLSADGRSITTASSANISLYKPENGPSLQLIGGRHLNNYWSVQGTYGWNRNDLTLTSSQASGEQFAFYEQKRKASTRSVIGELMVYFRRRGSRVRPYLSTGVGLVRVMSGAETIGASIGALTPVPAAFRSSKPALRVAVGIDWLLGKGWAFRFAFDETIRRNAISEHLMPPGQRNLANFQNMFGFVKQF
jgi:Outer membrane protein beta-barrel domain